MCLCHTARQYGPHPISDLLGVDYVYAVPPDTEFPYTARQFDLFVRFLTAGRGTARIAIRVWWLHADGSNRKRVLDYRPGVSFDPTAEVVSKAFRLSNVRCPGEGLYAVRVCHRVGRGWRGRRWRILGTDYFFVQR